MRSGGEKILKKRSENMVKGIERRVVELKIKDSEIYERACFILRCGEISAEVCERELINEAHRIVNSLCPSKTSKKAQMRRRLLFSALIFLLGALIGFALGALLV